MLAASNRRTVGQGKGQERPLVVSMRESLVRGSKGVTCH